MLQHLRTNFVGYLALFVALSGTAYAASSLPKNSVGTKQIKNRAVTAAKIHAGVIPHVPGIAWAVVDANGSIAAQKGVTSSAKTAAGAYTVKFKQSALGCAVVVSPSNTGGGLLEGAAANATTQPTGVVRVWTANADLTSTGGDEPFTIVEICP
jgi:hypothetical protein